MKNEGNTRLKTGIAGLDDILHGGLQSGHVYLIEGDPGTGKTTLGIQFLLAGVANGEATLYITLAAKPKNWPSPDSWPPVLPMKSITRLPPLPTCFFW